MDKQTVYLECKARERMAKALPLDKTEFGALAVFVASTLVCGIVMVCAGAFAS